MFRRLKRPLKGALRWEFERRYRADVEGHIYLDEFGMDADERVWHTPSDWLPTHLALRRARLEPHDVVADLGAGKGAVVLLAATLPVRRVIGVELVPELAESARRNVEANRRRIRAGDVDIVVKDALEWDVPDDLTVVYLYSPFLGDMFMGVVRRLLESCDRSPRPLRLLYNFPFEHNRLIGSGRVRVLDVAPARWPRLPGWWQHEHVIVTYGVGDGPFPPSRGLRPPAAAMRRWSGPNDTRFALNRPGRPTIWSPG